MGENAYNGSSMDGEPKLKQPSGRGNITTGLSVRVHFTSSSSWFIHWGTSHKQHNWPQLAFNTELVEISFALTIWRITYNIFPLCTLGMAVNGQSLWFELMCILILGENNNRKKTKTIIFDHRIHSMQTFFTSICHISHKISTILVFQEDK